MITIRLPFPGSGSRRRPDVHGASRLNDNESKTLHRLADRTRELLDELETGRPDLLSPVDLNRALKQLLRNQVAILRALTGAPGELAASTSLPRSVVEAAPQAEVPAEAPRAPTIRATPRPSSTSTSAAMSGTTVNNGNGQHPGPPTSSGSWSATDSVEELHDPEVLPDPPASSASAPAQEGAAAAPAAGTVAELFAAVRALPQVIARTLVELFDNRDKDYTKGLDKLNRWVDGGAGTPFQLRGDRAFLNARAAGAPAMRNYEEQLMSRMGFSLRLGRLVVPGFIGDVIVYERPS
jgi:hypothetical protein